MRTVVIPIESSRAAGRELLRGVAKYSHLHGPWAFYWEPGGLDEVVPRLRNLNADGIIMRDPERLEEVLSFGLPTVVFGHRIEIIPGVVNMVTDSKTIGRMAAGHLLNCGFKHFAFCGMDDKQWSKKRCASFCHVIGKEGLQTHVYTLPESLGIRSWEKEQGYVVEWLRTLPKPIGLLTCNDDRSQQVVQACKIAGLMVPEEVAIIGVDNDDMVCELSDPPLTSVAMNFERAAYEAAAVLDLLMQGKAVSNKVVTVHATHIVSRQSTDITAIEDSDVATAVNFIRQHANENIGVDDVVRSVSVSRRVLEKRFREYLGRTILEEIRRVRTNQIARMLVESNLSVTQIAMSLGFTGNEHIARYFRREKGMSLLEYRKQLGKR
jgi:LacI family transcriptional regulator